MPFLRPIPSKLSVAVAAGFVLAGCMTSSRIPAPVEHRDSAQAKGIVVEPGQAALETRQPGQADYRLAETPQAGVRGQWPQSRIAATDPNRPPRLEGSGTVAPLVQSGEPGSSIQSAPLTQPSSSAQQVQVPTEQRITRERITPSSQATVTRAPLPQTIRVNPGRQVPKAASADNPVSAAAKKKQPQAEQVATRPARSSKSADAQSASKETKQLAAAKVASQKKPVATEAGTKKLKQSVSANAKFIWPAHGALVQKFADKKSMGIGISGRAGDRVNATADGEVIFSGLGPRGYGKLLIVKHNPEILSVYAHNRSLLVKEGQAVRQGQKIAELGSTGTDRPKLHFEIRRQGKPVDPLAFLPSRK